MRVGSEELTRSFRVTSDVVERFGGIGAHSHVEQADTAFAVANTKLITCVADTKTGEKRNIIHLHMNPDRRLYLRAKSTVAIYKIIFEHNDKLGKLPHPSVIARSMRTALPLKARTNPAGDKTDKEKPKRIRVRD